VSTLISSILAGLFLGATFGLIALGYSMVYGVLRLINFAHGDIFMLGGFVSFSIFNAFGMKGTVSWLALVGVGLLTALITGGVGVAAEELVYRQMRSAPMLSLIVATLGVSMIIENAVLNIPPWGAKFRPFPVGTSSSGFYVLNQRYTYLQLVIVCIAIALFIGVYLVVQRTIIGVSMRAVATDRAAASLVGVNVNRVIATVFFVGGSLAGAAAVMYSLYYGQINYLMGFNLGLQAFTAAVLGGIGNVTGAVVGGMLLGIFQSLGVAYTGSQWALVFSFAALVLVLWLRPTGLLGERMGSRT